MVYLYTKKHKMSLVFIVFLIIFSFLSQSIAWAKGIDHICEGKTKKNDTLSSDSNMDDEVFVKEYHLVAIGKKIIAILNKNRTKTSPDKKKLIEKFLFGKGDDISPKSWLGKYNKRNPGAQLSRSDIVIRYDENGFYVLIFGIILFIPFEKESEPQSGMLLEMDSDEEELFFETDERKFRKLNFKIFKRKDRRIRLVKKRKIPFRVKIFHWLHQYGLLIFLLTLASMIFGPELYAYYYQEYFGYWFKLINGEDLATYYWGSEVYFEHGLDPYINQNWIDLNGKMAFQFDHPNPQMQHITMSNIKMLKGSYPYGWFGYVASPINLILIRLMNIFPFTFIYNIWPILSLMVHSLIVVKLSKNLSILLTGAKAHWKTILILVLPLVFMFYSPLISALALGQIEFIYMLFIGIAIYFYAFKRKYVYTPLIVAFALVMAAGVKIFPFIFIGYFTVKSLIKIWKDKYKAFKETSVKIMMWSFAIGLGIIALVFGLFGVDMINSWIHKISKFQEMYATIDIKQAPSLYFYVSKHFYWLESHIVVITMILAISLMFFAIRDMYRSTVDKFSHETIRFLIIISLIITLLPSFMIHWWHIYNTILIIPMLIVYFIFRKTPSDDVPSRSLWVKRIGLSSLFLSFILVNPSLWHLAQETFNIPWGESSYGGEGYGLNQVMNVVVGYPGALLLFVTTLLAHRWAIITGLLPKRKKKKDVSMTVEQGLSRDPVVKSADGVGERRRATIAVGESA
ncbi:glycosyltransferase 87 family protein [Chlamydiota bacterium]